MSLSSTDHEPTLFDPKPLVESKPEPRAAAQLDMSEPSSPHPATHAANEPTKAAAPATGTPDDAVAGHEDDLQKADATTDQEGEELVDASADSAQDGAGGVRVDRKRIAEQLDALRRKEAELLRALAISDHPHLADAIRTIEARVYGVSRADAKVAQGLSKSEARRQEAINKKLTSLQDKRAELNTQIESLEAELKELGAARMADFQKERQDALQGLMVALATHDNALRSAGLDAHALLPEIAAWVPELESIARAVSEPRAN